MAGPSLAWLQGSGLMDLGAPMARPGALTATPTAPPPADPFGLASMMPPPQAPAAAPPPPAPPPAAPPPVDMQPTPGDLGIAPRPGEVPSAPDPLAAPRGVTHPENIPAPPSPQGQAMPSDVQFRQVGGGVRPAGEAKIVGPRQEAHLMGSFEAPLEAADRIDARSGFAAQHEADVLGIHAEQALDRQAALEQAAVRRQAEMDALRADFDDQSARLGQMKLDNNRYWASKSTPDKIGSIILAFIGGLGALGNGGQNYAYNAMMKEMDQDIDAQKFDYMVQQDRTKGAQNAFAMAMEKYGSEDAAHGLARAAALDAMIAKTTQLQASWKGVEVSNQADDLRARLMSERERTAAATLRFIPAAAAPGKYKMYVRGQEIPGLVDEKRAQDISIQHGVVPAEKVDQSMVEGGIQAQLKGQEAAAKRAEKAGENAVQLPNGDVIQARNAKEMDELSKLSSAVHNANQLVARAKEIRSSNGWVVSPAAQRELKQISAELTLAFKDRGQLGALSGPDMDLANRATGDLTSVMPGIDKQLDNFAATTDRALRNRVRPIPGAADTAKGVMPGSFTPHGKK